MVDARLVTPTPTHVSDEEAATLPLVFLTAWYALYDLGKLKAKENILIHAAAGGVGMAATQIAQMIGANVFGTASAPKWDTLREMKIAWEAIASSRTLEFAERFAGNKMDVVLNALAGEFVDASFSLLSEEGRFLKMGKTDIRSGEWLEQNHPSAYYNAFDLLEAGEDKIQSMLVSIAQCLTDGWLKPLPHQAFPMNRLTTAFRTMAQGKHIGKVVVVPPVAGFEPTPVSTYWITGGLGALGQTVARWLAGRGVSHLLLTSRRGMEAPGAAEFAAELEAMGTQVTIAAADMNDGSSLHGLLQSLPDHLPLKGVIHAAGVLDDGVMGELSAERLKTVFEPKVQGAWHLHTLTQEMELDACSLFIHSRGDGRRGSGNYAAANVAWDALAHYRRSRGYAATSIAWGPWAMSGMAAEDEQRADRSPAKAPRPGAH